MWGGGRKDSRRCLLRNSNTTFSDISHGIWSIKLPEFTFPVQTNGAGGAGGVG